VQETVMKTCVKFVVQVSGTNFWYKFLERNTDCQ